MLRDHIAYFVDGKRGEDLVEYNMPQTLSIKENYLVVFVCPGICSKICLAICPKIYHAGKKLKKSHSLLAFASGPPFGGGLVENLGRP